MKYDSQKIAAAIKKAVEAARMFASVPDGGSCNFDSAFIRAPRMQESQAEEIEQLCGVRLSLHTYRYQGRILQIVGGLELGGELGARSLDLAADLDELVGGRAIVWFGHRVILYAKLLYRSNVLICVCVATSVSW